MSRGVNHFYESHSSTVVLNVWVGVHIQQHWLILYLQLEFAMASLFSKVHC